MKKYAFFLPQFHRIPENDEWWGEGFTEWTNVKAALPLYKNHKQPQKPLNDNYYNLLDKETVQWQTQLMKDHHVDGMIYYHYFFNGKLLLEKPAQNLLKWKDIDQKFFFCWANHSWRRTWQGSQQILLEQTYGDEQNWNEHFNYLLKFFKDMRYEKRHNKPVFMIFNSDFQEKKAMFDFFDLKCRENGFDGLCLIETYIGNGWMKNFDGFLRNLCEQTEFSFLREPGFAINLYWRSIKFTPMRIIRKIKKELLKKGIDSCVETYDGDRLYFSMKKYFDNRATFVRGLFFEWDNTPRHSSRGFIITPPSKKSFFEYMNLHKYDEYMFINAWNEWAEGMMLEPTEQNGFKYLEWIKEWSIVSGL